MFKKYPSCGLTQGVTELALQMVSEADISPGDIESIEIRLPPYAHRLVGHEFELGENARVNAQFSAAFCVANAVVNHSSLLNHFTGAAVANPDILKLVERIEAVSDPGLDARGHTAVDLAIKTKDKEKYFRQMDIAPGFPGNPLTDEAHLARFYQCIDYSQAQAFKEQGRRLPEMIEKLEDLGDIGDLLDAMVPAKDQ